ncbi:uncharacterized protein [Leptinotarsa decemlineata]|uniref:uncharacterized protein n=1 Tax=Leptinotarsa decemlineata TaxID=7539 RepID=UPI003D30A525
MEIWSYDTVQIDENTVGLFTDMMNKFIKIKQESSNWPQQCKTDEEKQQYIEEFSQREDVLFEFYKITDNPGLRSLAKLMLNSFWGKFGQRENQPKTSILNQPAEFFKMMTDPSRVINSVLTINEDTLIVNWEFRSESFDCLSTVNVVIAAYVTALARLKLYNSLERLDDRVLYYDTDSVIYVSKSKEYEIPTGQFIGDTTDELAGYGPGSHITEFVSAGPKNYSFRLWSTREQDFKVVCKVKGICLNYDASQIINFDSIKETILNP